MCQRGGPPHAGAHDADGGEPTRHGADQGARRPLPRRGAPQEPHGEALGYFENQWTCLSRFLDDGAIPIDNNSVERAIRPVAIGRGNWTFIGSEDAGPWAARLYGLLGTCRLQGINPYEWLKDVLDRVREHPPDRMYELTPRGWKHARAQTPPPA